MFRIECFCDDKKLASVLHMLAGHVVNLTSTPVKNAAKTKNGGMRDRLNGANIPLAFAEELRKRRQVEFNVGEVKAFLGANGASPQSTTYVISTLKQHKLITGPHKPKGAPNTANRYRLRASRPPSRRRKSKPSSKSAAA